ncbi:hypothetical protein C8P63_101201 [Melghirimyces profundicolus]|uniref:Uncharacterized protein n=1 Tax=Melghirimyces profundicolus TaxID=1242148 RepID=A0A2T6C9H9_9BACL|nr:hypothetical protein C8P63_101201 [Melghirimyces profundicolus]
MILLLWVFGAVPAGAADGDHERYGVALQVDYPVKVGKKTGMKVKARLKGVTKRNRIRGEWTVKADGEEMTVPHGKKKGPEKPVRFGGTVADRLKDGKKVSVTATFRGTIDGKKVRLSTTRGVTPPKVKVRVRCRGDRVEVGGTLTRTKKASGRWTFEVFPSGKEKPLDRYSSDEMTGPSHHVFLKRPDGPFEARVTVDGTVGREVHGDLFGKEGGRFEEAAGQVSLRSGCPEGTGGSVDESSTRALRIRADHQVLLGKKIQDLWIEVSDSEVRGVQMKGTLDTEEKAVGIWRFYYRYPDKVRLPGGKEKNVIRKGVLASNKGVVELPMRRKDEYHVIVDFQGTVGGQKVHVKEPYHFSIPRVMQKADPAADPSFTVIEAVITGRKVEGRWMMAIARPDGKILYLHEGKPRFTVKLPEGRYLLKTVFYGKVDGLTMAMQESKSLVIKEKDRDTYLVPGKNNELRTYEEGVSAVRGMRRSGRLSESDHTYSARAGAYSGGTAALLVIIGLAVYRKRKLS